MFHSGFVDFKKNYPVHRSDEHAPRKFKGESVVAAILPSRIPRMMLCTDRVEWLRQIRSTITHHHMWRSIWLPPHSINTGVKERPDSPRLNSLACTVFGPLLMESLLTSARYIYSWNQYVTCSVIVWMHPANEWMWTHNLGTPPFYFEDSVRVWSY